MIALRDKPNTSAPDSDYPYGNIQDKTFSQNGTPVNAQVYADIHQFFEKIMDAAGISSNGLPDNAYSGWQLYEALKGVFGGTRTAFVEIGVWDMDSDAAKIVNVSAFVGTDYTKVRNISAIIIPDSTGIVRNISIAGDCALQTSNASITLNRDGGGVFDSPSYSSTLVNRGWLKLEYVE